MAITSRILSKCSICGNIVTTIADRKAIKVGQPCSMCSTQVPFDHHFTSGYFEINDKDHYLYFVINDIPHPIMQVNEDHISGCPMALKFDPDPEFDNFVETVGDDKFFEVTFLMRVLFSCNKERFVDDWELIPYYDYIAAVGLYSKSRNKCLKVYSRLDPTLVGVGGRAIPLPDYLAKELIFSDLAESIYSDKEGNHYFKPADMEAVLAEFE